MFETDSSVTQSRRNATRGDKRGAWLASDHGNEMQYSGMAASLSVMGDNLESAPAGVAASERYAPQPLYTTQQQPLLVVWELILKIKGGPVSAQTATRR